MPSLMTPAHICSKVPPDVGSSVASGLPLRDDRIQNSPLYALYPPLHDPAAQPALVHMTLLIAQLGTHRRRGAKLVKMWLFRKTVERCLRPCYRSMPRDGFDMSLVCIRRQLADGASWAFSPRPSKIGIVRVSKGPEDGGETSRDLGRYIMVLRGWIITAR